METPSFDAFNEEQQHACIGHQEGDWIIFTCPLCRDYERRVNWKTSEIRVRRGNGNVAHFGSHAPLRPAIQTFGTN